MAVYNRYYGCTGVCLISVQSWTMITMITAKLNLNNTEQGKQVYTLKALTSRPTHSLCRSSNKGFIHFYTNTTILRYDIFSVVEDIGELMYNLYFVICVGEHIAIGDLQTP